jgi:nitroreductase
MDVYEVAVSRRSIRRFQDIPVPYQVLERCVDAARLAPSAANLQPLEYIIVNDDRLLDEVFATLGWAAYIRPDGDPPEGKRPKAYIVIVSNSGAASAFTAYDVGASMENMILVAWAEGIGSCPIANVDRDKLRGILHIPAEYEIPVVLALGYPDERPLEEPFDGSVKYWKNKAGVLHVPKKRSEMVQHWNTYL